MIITISRFLSISLVFTVVSGCGFTNSCTNSCDPGWVHGSADCGCMQAITSNSPHPSQPSSGPDFIVRRYFCTSSSNGTDAGTCDVTVNANSCQAAMNGIQDRFSASERDPCVRCTSGITDNTRRWNGHYEDIQSGPCQGYSNNFTPIGRSFSDLLRYLWKTSFNPLTDNSIESCQKACEEGNPFCLRLEVAHGQLDGIIRLQQLTTKSPPIIKAVDLQNMFGMASDLCNRSDTVFDNGEMTNKGDACSIKTQLPMTDVTISIPELLRSKWTAAYGLVELRFDNVQTRAFLEFSDDFLNKDFGGPISALSSREGVVHFSIGSTSCIRAIFK